MFEARFTTALLAETVVGLAGLEDEVGDAERIDQIRLLEELKSAAAAAQARVTARFVESQKAAQEAAGVASREVGQGIAAQVALAKRESPARATRYVGWAAILVGELPCTFRALQEGRISEWRAQIVARETGWLSREHREQIDGELAPLLTTWGDRRVEAEVKKLAYRLDPRGFLARIRGAEADRRVTLRPAPDTMSLLSGFLPVAQGVSVIASLQRQADSLRASGDQRSRGQIMADTLVERVTGQATADAVPVQVQLVMTSASFFNAGPGADEPAELIGHGSIPAELARRLVVAADDKAEAWVRRLFTSADGCRLVAMESTSRTFDGGLGDFLVMRDRSCRTPWCDAPVRHRDHVVAVEHGGSTSEANGQGLCEACNYAKQSVGWQARASGGGAGEEVVTVTPTGHTYASSPPDPPGRRRTIRMDNVFAEFIAAA
jgi:hypothetical protein